MHGPTLSALALLSLLACGHASPAPQTAPAATPASSPAAAALPLSPRELAPDAVYADLVRNAAQLEANADVPRRCLLGRRDKLLTFEAELALALRPLPQPSPELDSVLKRAPTVRLLSAWGRYGQGNAPLTLAAFTYTPPSRGAVALIVTERGISLRGSEAGTRAVDALTPAAAVRELGDVRDTTVFVAAAAQTKVGDVLALLEQLAGVHAVVALAVNLAPDTNLPAPASSVTAAKRCPEGIGETATVEGDLSMRELAVGVAPLQERAGECLTHAEGRGAAGGRLTLAMRIDADGSVSDACVVADETEDIGLEACLLGLTRALRFAAPSPAGTVDAELPLVLRANSAPAQALACPSAQ